MVEQLQNRQKDLGLDEDWNVLLRCLLEVNEDLVNLLLRLVEFHGLLRVLHAQRDVGLVERV